MAVSKKIVDLTRLALQDRVLTYKERQTIVKVALEEGVPEPEINAFLDNMLNQRLKTLAKEELCSCPGCGAQIPLISEDCMYCGIKLEKGAVVQAVNISGEEAEIIRSENLRTEKKEQNIKNCPTCGAPFPFMSNVCPSCGYVHHARLASEFNVKKLISNIEDSTNKLLNSPNPTFLEVVRDQFGKIFFIFMMMVYISMPLYAGLIAKMSGALAGFFLIILILLAPIAIGALKMAQPTLTERSNSAYFEALYNYNKYTRFVEVFYGENQEARTYLAKLSDVLKKATKKRRLERLKLAIFLVLAMLLPFIPNLLIPSSWIIGGFIEDGFTIFK